MVAPKTTARKTRSVGSDRRVDVSQARREFADLVSRVGYGRDRVVLCRNGKSVAALIPVDDLQFLEQLENERDVAEARQILAKSKFYTSAQARRKLGIK